MGHLTQPAMRNALATSVPESLQNPGSREHRNDVPRTAPFWGGGGMSSLYLLSYSAL